MEENNLLELVVLLRNIRCDLLVITARLHADNIFDNSIIDKIHAQYLFDDNLDPFFDTHDLQGEPWLPYFFAAMRNNTGIRRTTSTIINQLLEKMEPFVNHS